MTGNGQFFKRCGCKDQATRRRLNRRYCSRLRLLAFPAAARFECHPTGWESAPSTAMTVRDLVRGRTLHCRSGCLGLPS